LNAAVAGFRVAVRAGSGFERFAPDHVSLHRDLFLGGRRPSLDR
jgi:hypothetical protein